MYLLIVLVITAKGSNLTHIPFNSETKCLSALSQVLDYEKEGSVAKIRANCVAQ